MTFGQELGDEAPKFARVGLVSAHCRLSDGTGMDLPVAMLSLAGATVLAMRPPAVGSCLSLTLRSSGTEALLAMQARVIAARLDPLDPGRCGFEVVFTDVEDDTLEALASLLASFEHAVPCPVVRERREYPRVDIELRAEVGLDAGPVQLTVQNISMSGALLGLDDSRLGSALLPGEIHPLLIFDANTPEPVLVRAQVVRWVANGPAGALAVRFAAMDEGASRRLEGLIVYALIGRKLPRIYA